jgi:hypothetical protein
MRRRSSWRQAGAPQQVLEPRVRPKRSKLGIYLEPIQVITHGHVVVVNSVPQPVKSPIFIA